MNLLSRRLGRLAQRLGPAPTWAASVPPRWESAAPRLSERGALSAVVIVMRYKPREEIGPAVERGQPAVGAYERLLGDVVGVAVVTEDMERGGVHASLMAPDQATDSFSVPLACPVEVCGPRQP